VKRFRGGLVFKAHRVGVSLNSRLESNKEEHQAIERCFSSERGRNGEGGIEAGGFRV